MITLKTFVFNPFQENTYVLHDETRECIIIDPGCCNIHENEKLKHYLHENKLIPIAIVNTHCHIDHIAGIQYLRKHFNIPLYANKADNFLLETAKEQGQFFGFEIEQTSHPEFYLTEGQTFKFGNTELQIFEVPGHSPGSIALYSELDAMVITGDALFNGSIGRTDLPGGDYDVLMSSIRSKLLSLPANVMIFPGHGPSSTIGQEYDTNPFLAN